MNSAVQPKCAFVASHTCTATKKSAINAVNLSKQRVQKVFKGQGFKQNKHEIQMLKSQ